MSLGFSVEALVPAGRGAGALRTELVRLAEAEWLWPPADLEPDLEPNLAARVDVFARHPGSVMVYPGAEAAAREAAQLVAGRDTLAEAAGSVWEDLCVLEADGAAEHGGFTRLTAAAVGFPTHWRLSEKMGEELTAIHAPIHGYREQLAEGVSNFLDRLEAGPIWGRANWFVLASAAPRYLPTDDAATRFAHVTGENAGETLFVRCERQTLRRLPETRAVLFTIGIAVEPLGRLSDGLVARIAGNVAGLAGGEQAGEFWRRAAPHYAAPLGHYASARGAALENAA